MKTACLALVLAATASVAQAQGFVPMADDPWPTVRALMESQNCWAHDDQLLTLMRDVFGYPVYQVLDFFRELSENPDFEYGASVTAWALVSGPRCG